MMKNKLIIVGLDPGTTTGIAILNLEGEILGKESRKEFGKSQISEYIISKGKPLIISTDVEKAPSLVEKISSTFGAELYVPEGDLTTNEKEEITKDIDYEDSHTRDAAASAITAFNENEKLFERVRNKLRELNKLDKFEDVVEIVFNNSISISNALKEIEKAEESEKAEERRKESKNWKKISKRLREDLEKKRERIEHLEEYVDKLKAEKKNLEERIEDLNETSEERRKEIIKEEEIEKRTELVKRKQKEIERLKREVNKSKGRNKKLKDIMKKMEAGWEKAEVIKDEDELENTESRIVFLEKNIEPGKISESVEIVITSDKISKLEDQGTLSIKPEDVEFLKENNICIVKEKDLKDEIEEGSSRFFKWLKKYREKRRDESIN